MRALVPLAALAAFSCLTPSARAQTPAASPRELYESLNALRIDPAAVYTVHQLELPRPDVRLSFEEGTLAFLTPLQGHTTGAVFTGRGHALAVPRDPVEKQQLARFLGAPLLDQEFHSAYLRFDDNSAEELTQQLHGANLSAHEDTAFVAEWSAVLSRLNPPHSLRILEDWLADTAQPYFSAALDGVTVGAFSILVDPRRDEPVFFGQPHVTEGTAYYDVWASYRPIGMPPPAAAAFRAMGYAIDATIPLDHSIEGTTSIRVRAERAGERMLTLELSRELKAESAEVLSTAGGDAKTEPLVVFQNEGLSQRERIAQGKDYLVAILPRPSRRGEEFTLRLRYRGSVISDAGNGVLFVGARGSWYPRLGGMESFADYDLMLRWPRKLRLVATGAKLDEHEEGEMRSGHWRSELPIPVAGFNLGEYASASVSEASFGVDVYANHELEEALRSRLARSSGGLNSLPMGTNSLRLRPGTVLDMPAPVPSPADDLRQIAREVSSSIRFYETYSGAFPLHRLSVSQIPGTFGQGWPGLLYVSTLSFLPESAQARAGLSSADREHFSELVPFHEVAHQWWGNVVGWSSYRDQWIDEAIASYLSLLFADSQKTPDRTLRDWLERYRAQLVEKPAGEDMPPADTGPLALGSRLTSSKSPRGFEEVVYAKGAWVMHMLRMMLRQPAGANPDARFVTLLRALAEKYAYRGLSTEDLQREVEAVMTPAMDLEGVRSMEWFFEDYVRGVGIPHYRVEFTAKQVTNGYLVRGKLFQSGVPRGFIAPVPVFAAGNAGHPVLLGTVVTSGEVTSFRFLTTRVPHKLIIDPQRTLLCVVE